MTINYDVEQVLLEIANSIKIHTIDKDNMIIELDYDKYVEDLVNVFKKHYQDSQEH